MAEEALPPFERKGFRVQGLRFRVEGLGIGVQGSRKPQTVKGSRFKAQR